jgi:Protein kinase domain
MRFGCDWSTSALSVFSLLSLWTPFTHLALLFFAFCFPIFVQLINFLQEKATVEFEVVTGAGTGKFKAVNVTGVGGTPIVPPARGPPRKRRQARGKKEGDGNGSGGDKAGGTPAGAAAAAVAGEDESKASSTEKKSNNRRGRGEKRPAPALLSTTCGGTSPDANARANEEAAEPAFPDPDTVQHAIDEAARLEKGIVELKAVSPHTAFWSNKEMEFLAAFGRLGPDNARSGVANIVAMVQATPHLHSEQLNALSRELNLEEEQSQVAQEESAANQATSATSAQNHFLVTTRDHLSPEYQELYDDLKPESKEKCFQQIANMMRNEHLLALQNELARKQAELARKQAELARKLRSIKEELTPKLHTITEQASVTEAILSRFSTLSQADGSLTQNTTAVIQQKHAKIQRDELVQDLIGEGGVNQFNTGIGPTIERIISYPKTFSHVFDEESLKTTNPSSRLARVSEVFQQALESATFLNKPSKQERQAADAARTLKSSIKQTVDKLKARFRSALDGSAADPNIDLDELCFPGPTSNEVDGVQPIVMALLEAVANCVQLDLDDRQDAMPSSPPKMVSEQKIVFGGVGRRERKCDACVWKRGRYIVVMLDGSIQVTIEIKPGQRTGHSIGELRREAMDQALSHMSKSLLDSLRFAHGAGVPSYATSVIATMVYIEVFQLRLLCPGTTSSHIELFSSGPLALVRPELFDKWFEQQNPSGQRDASGPRAVSGKKKRQDSYDQPDASAKEVVANKHGRDLEDMRNRLFAGGKTNGVPLGLKALYAIMAASRQSLVGPEWKDVSNRLGRLLGTGSFGMVFSSKLGGCAIKLSKTDFRLFIEHEAIILGSLAEVQGRPSSIPQLISSGLLDVDIGGVSCKLPAIAMKPVGEDIYPILLGGKASVCSIIDCILNGGLEALKFLHRHGIAHNDVSDRNLLLVPEKIPGEYRAVLVDFSVASQMYEKRRGLTGTAPFVHDDVHIHYEWFPVPKYDSFSLGLTLVVLLARGVIPWKNLGDKGPTVGDKGPTVGECVYKNRIKKATELVNKLRGSKNLTEVAAPGILELIHFGTMSFRNKCQCIKTKCGNQCGCRAKEKSCSVLCACYDEQTSTFRCENGDRKLPKKAVASNTFEQNLSDTVDDARP